MSLRSRKTLEEKSNIVDSIVDVWHKYNISLRSKLIGTRYSVDIAMIVGYYCDEEADIDIKINLDPYAIEVKENKIIARYVPMKYGMRPENMSDESVYELQELTREIETRIKSINKKIKTGKVSREVADQFLVAIKQCDDTA